MPSGLDKRIPKALQHFWNHPAGPKTVFFWAPTLKWGLVLAGLQDILTRPADTISVKQCMSLILTGLVWSRYSVVITPKNYNLLSVNAFLTMTQIHQLSRALKLSKSWDKEKQ